MHLKYIVLLAAALTGSAGWAQVGPASPEPADHAAHMPASVATPAPSSAPKGDVSAKSEAAADHAGHTDQLVPKTAQLLPGYGNGGFAITTANPQAQAFFSNGLELGAAFAHEAAKAAMEEAVRLDPACAMCRWGQAYVTAPTINYGATREERKPLLKLAKDARVMAAKTGTPREQALTRALVQRFRPGEPGARDRAFARAMQAVQRRFPKDNEIAVLTADALMVAAFTYPGPEQGEPWLRAANAQLEPVLARAPDHTPAIHFYIHGTEVAGEPGKAEAAADRLAALAPNASHLVHMPSHTYYWVGRYADAARTNRAAVEIGKANAKTLGIADPVGVFGLPYHSHNVIYGLGGALMSGDSAIALDLARPLVAAAAARDKAGPISQLLAASGYFAIARFDPASVADLPEPKLPYLKAARAYAQGEAAAWRGDAAGIETAIAAIPEKVADKPDDEAKPAEQMLGITRAVLQGRLATLRGDHRVAAAAFLRGAEIEETPSFNTFTDPPAFWYPVRRDVAAALLAAGDRAGAQAAAEASLKLRMKDPVAEALLAKAREPGLARTGSW